MGVESTGCVGKIGGSTRVDRGGVEGKRGVLIWVGFLVSVEGIYSPGARGAAFWSSIFANTSTCITFPYQPIFPPASIAKFVSSI